jgi:hypothetical protein
MTRITAEQFASMSDAEKFAAFTAMQAQRTAKLTLKVSDKGAVSVYGMGRWPVTLYGSQWERLLDAADAIRAFLKVNASALATKE